MNREFNVLGDKVDPYICFTNSHDGTGAIRVLMTRVRVVCNNTLNMALRNNSRQWSTRHVGDIAAKLAEAKRTLGLAAAYLEESDTEANVLADIAINEFKAREIVNELLPIDPKASDRSRTTFADSVVQDGASSMQSATLSDMPSQHVEQVPSLRIGSPRSSAATACLTKQSSYCGKFPD